MPDFEHSMRLRLTEKRHLLVKMGYIVEDGLWPHRPLTLPWTDSVTHILRRTLGLSAPWCQLINMRRGGTTSAAAKWH